MTRVTQNGGSVTAIGRLGARRILKGLPEVAERRGDEEQAMEHLDRAGDLFSRYGAKLYLDQVLAKKQILRA